MPPPSNEDEAPRVRRVAVVMNSRSGARQAGLRRDEMARAFDRLGADAAFVEVADADALRAAVAGQARTAGGAVVAAGGDGTVNTVANALAFAQRTLAVPAPPLGIIAFGTFNYVGRRYGLDESLDGAVRTVVCGRTIGIPAGEVSGRLFLNNCSLGLYTSVIDARERHKRVFGRSQVVALASGIATMLGRHARPLIRIGQDGRQRMLRASLVFVGANPLQLAELDPAIAQRVDDGALALVIVRAVDLRRLLGFAWRALTGAVIDAPEVEAEVVQSVTLALRRRRVGIVVDGERLDMPATLDIRWHRDILRLRVPAEAGAPSGGAREPA